MFKAIKGDVFGKSIAKAFKVKPVVADVLLDYYGTA